PGELIGGIINGLAPVVERQKSGSYSAFTAELLFELIFEVVAQGRAQNRIEDYDGDPDQHEVPEQEAKLETRFHSLSFPGDAARRKPMPRTVSTSSASEPSFSRKRRM